MVLEWKKPVEFGSPDIDAAHRQLFEWVVDIDQPPQEAGKSAITVAFLSNLGALFRTLFPAEDALMGTLKYGNARDHGEDHEYMLKDLTSLVASFDEHRPDSIQRAIDFIIFTTAGHVETMDRPLAQFIAKEKNRPPLTSRRSGFDPGQGQPAPATVRTPTAPRIAAQPSAALSSGQGEDAELLTLRSLILDTYTQALLKIKTERDMTGSAARAAACVMTAHAVSTLSGRKISRDMVEQMILSSR